MQLYATDKQKRSIFALHAKKGTDYHCLECNKTVRVRRGFHRHPHFYHLSPTKECRQNKKSLNHLQIQQTILEILPSKEAQMEVSFPEIKRIADIAWSQKKLIFEVQCSPITAEEVLQRNSDYAKIGWTVIWILHDFRYRKRRVTAAEEALTFQPHYYTNINQEGKGEIYDCLDVIEKGLRRRKLASLPIDLNQPCKIHSTTELPPFLPKKTLSFEGDLLHLYTNEAKRKAAKRYFAAFSRAKEEIQLLKENPSWTQSICETIIFRPYRILFRILLERSC